MKIDDLWKQQQQYTRDVTEHSRKLAFAVAAICWFFKSPDTTFPPAILGALIFLVGFFVADVTHYFWAAVRYRRFNYRAEEKLKNTLDENPEVAVTRRLDKPIFVMFCIKTALLMVSFLFLLSEFFFRLGKTHIMPHWIWHCG
jgi:hypothetical protein